MPRATSPRRERGEAILEGRAGHRLVIRIGFAAGDMRIRARLALENDLFLAMPAALQAFVTQTAAFESTGRAFARALASSSGVSTPSGTLFDHRDVDAHAGVERAQLLELLALLVGRRRQLDETLQRRAPVNIEPDVVVVRAGAGRVGAREGRARADGRARPCGLSP